MNGERKYEIYEHMMEYFSAIKRRKFCHLGEKKNMNGSSDIMLSESSKSQNDEYYMISLLYEI